MALPSRLASQFRSSAALIRNGAVKKAFSTQSAGKSRSMLGNAAPFLIGATAATSTLLAAKYFYDNKDKYTVLRPVHAASRMGNKSERTFIMVKPDGVQRGLVGDIIKRFEQKGFKLVAMKFVHADEDHLRKHYEDLKALPFFPGLVKFVSSGPVVAMVWEGVGVVKTGRVMLGETNPADSKPGTIRGDYCVHIGRIMADERTFLMIKPDAVHRGLIGEIITRFEKKGFKLVAMKFVKKSEKHFKEHYAELSQKKFFAGLVKYMSESPVVAMVWEGKGVVSTARVMLGETNPVDSKPGTIRGDLSIDIGRNIIHGSDSVETAKKEISLWFQADELNSWTPNDYTCIYE
ncbi:nucleoside diphosphate kinase 4, chloroplastic-like [Actinia tenebrosa]|uniref:Nucleoside diphosphate kinase n=1 Tax=Actinia tenebrosa TaxID=6105 RepID=A0A6P8IAB7_ACTTE|nr:nucleoside diphosphate kinase 4, chloroplastic-like [Actinia tenebrosa]